MKILCTGAPRSGTSMLTLLMTYFEGLNVYMDGTPNEASEDLCWKKYDCFTTQQRPDGFIWNHAIRKKSLRDFANEGKKVVCIYRDGRDALISKRRTFKHTGTEVTAEKDINYWYGPEVSHCEKWLNSIDEVIDIIKNPHKNIFLIQYEELVSNHEKVMKDLESFIGLKLKDYSQFYKDFKGKYNLSTEGAVGAEHSGLRPLAPNSGNWKASKHSKRMMEILREFPAIKDKLIELGYEKDNNWAEDYDITFVIPSRNNLDLLKLAYKSIKELTGQHHILILNDASEDGTQEWLDSLDDNRLHIHENPGPKRVGIVGMFDKGIEIAPTKIICAFHADMVSSRDLDIHLLEHVKKGTVVCATRVEPSLHPPGPEKIINDFGLQPDDFDYDRWMRYKPVPKQKVTNGIFAPWCMYKEDFLAIGGHDELFAPQSREDSDLFNRFYLQGYKLIQTREGLVYHFTSRGSRFNKYSGGDIGKDSPEWQATNAKNMRNFIRKWGTNVQHDEYMMPIVSPVYDIGFILHNPTMDLVTALEPFCNDLYGDWVGHKGFGINKYIEAEQKRTTYNLSKKFHSDHFEAKNDIVIEIDCTKLTQEDFNAIQQLGDIINESGGVGKFKLLNLNVTINKLEQLQIQNIMAK